MERRNYFEMVGLEFDPPEKNLRKIQKAIEIWKKETEKIIANDVDNSRNIILKKELTYYEDMVKVLSDLKLRNQEAHKLRDTRVNQLEKLLDILQYGKNAPYEITLYEMDDVHKKLKLSIKTIRAIFKSKGFKLYQSVQNVKLTDIFLSPIIFNEINSKILQLQSISDNTYPWFKNVKNLFDLAFYFKNDGYEYVDYRYKKTEDLFKIMKLGAQKFARNMSTEGHLLEDLFTAGNMQIFNSELNRKKYEQSLKKNKLIPFFALLKSAPDTFKYDSIFAENCIKNIQKLFYDYDISLSLYNQGAGIVKKPYEPIKANFNITCPNCHSSMTFHSRKEAEGAKCWACGKPLFIECPHCHRLIPASAEWCLCGFRMSEMRFVNEYCVAARCAFNKKDYITAEIQLKNAERAYPEHPNVIALKNQIGSALDAYKKSIIRLHDLIRKQEYYKANALIARIVKEQPNLNIDNEKMLVQEKISYADRMMIDSLLTNSNKADYYVDILRNVKDYRPAIDFLRLCRPKMPSNLKVNLSSSEPLICKLSWNASIEKGISYCIVRKENGIPQKKTDGLVLATNLVINEFTDRSIQSGIMYGYAVFCCRYYVYSTPATCQIG
ncbi:hypothetical protein [Megasphaera elsdenii]|uniref:hypothetical protein n=1 Tax=Megasphaera elsdenii TaxID=907 RepID=UPI00352273B6